NIARVSSIELSKEPDCMSAHRLSNLAAASFTLAFAASLVGALGACDKGPPEIVGRDPAQKSATPAAGGAGVVAMTTGAGTPAGPVTAPLDLKAATDGVPGAGALYADLDTEQGKISCKLFDDKAPTTVGNFVALARGLQSFNDPVTHKWIKRAAYDGTVFHRVIDGFMIQGGDPSGMGTGDPGYTFADEIWPGATHDRAGLLCMANKGKNTNGMQFFITDAATPHLDPLGHTIFGQCSPLDVVHKIATLPKDPRDKPSGGNKILKVTIRRS
ncbi:MAG: peptidylprolyl isomerase, partial [Polyangiales bacterium]